MDTYILMIFLAYTVPAGVDGVGGGAAITTEKQSFWSERDCMTAAKLLLGAFDKNGFRRSAVVCLKSSGPSSEPQKEASK